MMKYSLDLTFLLTQLFIEKKKKKGVRRNNNDKTIFDSLCDKSNAETKSFFFLIHLSTITRQRKLKSTHTT